MSDPTRYIWRVKYKGEDTGWHEIDLEKVRRKVEENYIDSSIILSAMMDGLVAQTSFAEYKATLRRKPLDT